MKLMKVWVAIAAVAGYTSFNTVFARLFEPSDSLVDDESDRHLNGVIDEEVRQLAAAGEPRIVGGQTAGVTEFSYFAQVWDPSGSSTSASGLCGGTLIHSDIILTGANCDDIALIISSSVVVGAYYPKSSLQGTVRYITAKTIHPYFNDVTSEYDFLVLKLNSPVPTLSVPINTKSYYPFPNDQLTVIGLGTTFDGGQSSSSTLLKAKVNYIRPSTCSNYYAGIQTVNSNVQFCAGVSGGGVDSCVGDGGGPIINANGVQVGVVSTGLGCARPSFPGIYARTSYVSSWIKQQVCSLSSYPPTYCYSTLPLSVTVRIDVAYDNYPSTTSFNVFNSSQAVYSSGAGASSYANLVVSTTLPLTPGYYFLQHLDSLGRTTCCSTGIRFFAAFAVLNGLYRPLIRPLSSTFGYSVNVAMPVPTNPSRLPKTTTVRIEIYYDRFPTETAFTLYNSLGQAVRSSGLGLSSYATTLVSYEYNVPSGLYTLQITDRASDGICCKYGLGYYAVYAVLGGAYSALATPTYASSFKTLNVVFYLPTISRSGEPPDKPTLPTPPTSIFATVCQDTPTSFTYNTTTTNSANGTTTATTEVHTQTCQWLSSGSKPQLKKTLCQPNQEAYKACPMTCGACVNTCEGQDTANATFVVDGASHNCAWLKTQSSLWPLECVAGKPAYELCKDVCHSCKV